MDFSERQKMSLDIVVTAENVQTGVCFDISGVKKKKQRFMLAGFSSILS